jgi:hypothetical protein
VSFDIGNWKTKDQDAISLDVADVACIRIMVGLQEETFRQFKEAFSATDKSPLRLRRALVRWARSAETHEEALCFTVDFLIHVPEDAEDRRVWEQLIQYPMSNKECPMSRCDGFELGVGY